jgi:hypothetical protein
MSARMTSNARLGKMIRLLSSDKPGEVLAAAGAINRAMQSAGMDIHELAEVVESQLKFPLVPHHEPAAPRRSPRAAALNIGDRIVCDEDAGIFRTCGCGSARFTVHAGTGPHWAQLRCDACGVGGRWLGRHHLGCGVRP